MVEAPIETATVVWVHSGTIEAAGLAVLQGDHSH